MANEGIFRFTTFRAPKEKVRRPVTKTRFPLYQRDGETELQRAYGNAVADGVPRSELVKLAEDHKRTASYLRNLAPLPLDVTPLLQWAASNASSTLSNLDFNQVTGDLYQQSLAQLTTRGEFQASRTVLADTLLADSLSRRREPHARDVNLAFKLLSLLDQVARGETLPFADTLGDYLANVTIAIATPLGPQVQLPATTELPSEGTELPAPSDPYAPLRQRLSQLAAAHRELSRVTGDENALTAKEAARTEEPPRTEGAPASPLGDKETSGSVTLSRETLDSLSETTRQALGELRFRDDVDPFRALSLLEDDIQDLGQQLASAQQPTKLLLLGGAALDAQKFKESFGYSGPAALGNLLFKSGCGFAAGVGDLLIVQQKLKAYEVAEFAHVENVLAGEAREREHRRLHVTEEINVTETESEVEKERDLQSTDRNELQDEASKTVKDQFNLQAGVQVSGSYGPSVSFTSSLNTGFSTSVEESQKKAATYSREVTEKAAERTRERVRNETRRRVLDQIEEINRHKIENGTTEHVRGIYRWLNKIYDAQVFRYGQRMMYEFIIPEPAAFFLWAIINNPPKEIELEKPEPPMFPPTSKTQPLRPGNLTRDNYQDYVAKYKVSGVAPPPPQYQYTSYFDKQDGNSKGHYGRSGKIEIPAGYRAIGARVHANFVRDQGDDSSGFRIWLGTRIWNAKSSTTSYQAFNARLKEVAIGYLLANAYAFTLAVDVQCELTADGFAKWQQETYDAILTAYQQQQADYDSKMAALQVQKGSDQQPQFGRNPIENQRIVRDELKKLVIEMLTGQTHLDINSISLYGASKEPIVNLTKACPNGAYIRFFENAFEWNNLLYVLYPYFWGRHATWVSALHLTDADSDFTAFLKAGAARVQVPVRLGFEAAVAHFCQFGEIWEGHDPPLMDDDLYVPIIDEITENLGKPEDPPTPYPLDGKPWEVTVPTALVLLENIEEVPGIRDILTGQSITLVKANA